jgi:hypothetical protein
VALLAWRVLSGGQNLSMPDKSEVSIPAKAPALCALGLGISLSILAGVMLKSGQERAWEEEVRKLAQDRAEVIRSQVARSMEVLHAVAAFFDARGEVSRQEFKAFVERPLARQPELQALAWDVRVPGAERGKWEARARSEGFPNFGFTEEKSEGGLVPAKEREEYFPVFYVESLEKNAPAHGFDVGSEPRRRAALEQAWTTGLPRKRDRSRDLSCFARSIADRRGRSKSAALRCKGSPRRFSASAIWWNFRCGPWAKTEWRFPSRTRPMAGRFTVRTRPAGPGGRRGNPPWKSRAVTGRCGSSRRRHSAARDPTR